MATVPSTLRDAFVADLSLVQDQIRAGIVPTRAAAADRHWLSWCAFCLEHQLDPHLQDISDPVPTLQVWATRYRDGRLAPGGHPVRTKTVEDAVRAVGQTFARMGSHDIRQNSTGQLDYRLKQQFQCWRREDPAPHRVKPIPIAIVHYTLRMAYSGTSSDAICAYADIITIGYFFLMRPGEYTGTHGGNSAAIQLGQIQLRCGTRRLDLWTATATELHSATTVAFTFDNQKNGVRGEVISHGRTGQQYCCPTLATVRRILYLRAKGATVHTPLASYWSGECRLGIKSSDITRILRQAVVAIGTEVGLVPTDIEARSLRAGGAMALLNGGCDDNIIKLMGRWRSDAMLRYLHGTAAHTTLYAARMVTGGAYHLVPGTFVPQHPLATDH